MRALLLILSAALVGAFTGYFISDSVFSLAIMLVLIMLLAAIAVLTL